jgi:cytochrome c biogenesis protein CcmG/thiol:disulfide interchange protein DsbE
MVAPPFTGQTLDGEEVSLESLRGHVVILNFWATWCAPCRKELPLLDGYMRARETNGLRVVAVTLDAGKVRGAVIRKLQDVLALPLLKTFRGDYEPIGKAIPTNYVIDRSGVVRYAKSSAFTLADLNELLVPLLNEAPPAGVPPGNASAASTAPATATE